MSSDYHKGESERIAVEFMLLDERFPEDGIVKTVLRERFHQERERAKESADAEV